MKTTPTSRVAVGLTITALAIGALSGCSPDVNPSSGGTQAAGGTTSPTAVTTSPSGKSTTGRAPLSKAINALPASLGGYSQVSAPTPFGESTEVYYGKGDTKVKVTLAPLAKSSVDLVTDANISDLTGTKTVGNITCGDGHNLGYGGSVCFAKMDGGRLSTSGGPAVSLDELIAFTSTLYSQFPSA